MNFIFHPLSRPTMPSLGRASDTVEGACVCAAPGEPTNDQAVIFHGISPTQKWWYFMVIYWIWMGEMEVVHGIWMEYTLLDCLICWDLHYPISWWLRTKPYEWETVFQQQVFNEMGWWDRGIFKGSPGLFIVSCHITIPYNSLWPT